MCWHYNNRAQSRYFTARSWHGASNCLFNYSFGYLGSKIIPCLIGTGLVGALSIVRFRTPIKEPEELAYIFLAIAIGLALGADQIEVAVVTLPIILAVISLIDRIKKNSPPVGGNLILSIEVHQRKQFLIKSWK